MLLSQIFKTILCASEMNLRQFTRAGTHRHGDRAVGLYLAYKITKELFPCLLLISRQLIRFTISLLNMVLHQMLSSLPASTLSIEMPPGEIAPYTL